MAWLRNIATQLANTADICRFIDVTYDSYISNSYELLFYRTSVIIYVVWNEWQWWISTIGWKIRWKCDRVQSHFVPIICRSNFYIFKATETCFLSNGPKNFSHCEIVSSLCKRRGGTFAPQRLDYLLVTNRCELAVAQSVISCRVLHRFQSFFYTCALSRRRFSKLYY